MKKLSSLFLIVVICFLMSACDSGNANSTLKNPSSEQQSSTTDTSGQTQTQPQSQETNTSSALGKSENNVIDITEKFFITYVSDVYMNPNNYLGKTIKMEGIFTSESYNNKLYHFVYRNGPGCCGNDGGMCGFEVTYDGAMPQKNDWVRMSGILEEYYENGQQFLVIRAKSLEVLQERGLETVTH